MQNNYTKQLDELINSKVKGFTFCGMAGCNESPVAIDGIYVEATWGIIIHLANKNDIVFTWCEDKQVGDPFFICVKPTDGFIYIDSLESQDATGLFPWSNYVDQTISSIATHTYLTNYCNSDRWHDVIWGIELEFSNSQTMLIGALHHGDFEQYLICADEVVAIFDSKLIQSVKKTRSTFRSEWSTYETRSI
jgi:hypothetical protein